MKKPSKIEKYDFYFVLLSRFPTEKAYGVTTENTARALSNMGLKTLIITPVIFHKGISKIGVISRIEFIARFLLSTRVKSFVSLRFNIFILLYAFSIRLKSLRSFNVFWCRDIYLALLLSSFSSDLCVCEVHRTPVKFQMFCLRILSKRKNVILAPIADFLPRTLNLHQSRTVLAPMAINQDDLDFFSKFSKPKENTIIYVGHAYSLNYSLNINLLNEAAKNILKLYPNWKFKIIGIEENFFRLNITSPKSPNLELTGIIPREEVLIKLATASIGLTIYPNNKWFKDSFPIKIVEYSAAGLAIIASKSISHTRVLDDARCLYFEIDSVKSLVDKLDLLIKDKKLRNRLAKNSQSWSQNYTYENRASSIIGKLKTLI